jgi:hypothetical protein
MTDFLTPLIDFFKSIVFLPFNFLDEIFKFFINWLPNGLGPFPDSMIPEIPGGSVYSKFADVVNWVIPLDTMVTCLEIYATSVSLYFFGIVIMRWFKLSRS